MSKYIKLEDAIEAYNQAVTLLVESEMEEFNLGDFTECSFNTTQIKLIARMIESLPTIEIVHCGECKHYRTDISKVGGTYNGCGVWIDDGNEIEVEPNQFCSYGERIDNE